MICGYCGKEIPDDTIFCPECGTSQEIVDEKTAAQNPEPEAIKVKPVNKKRLIGISAVAVVVIILLCVLFGGRTEKQVIDQYVKYTISGELTKIRGLIPKVVVDAIKDKGGYDYETLWQEEEDALKERIKEAGYKYKSHKITAEKEYDRASLGGLNNRYKQICGKKVDIEAAKRIEVEVKIIRDGEIEEGEMEITIMKIGNKWYLEGVDRLIYS